jgi:alanine racemase
MDLAAVDLSGEGPVREGDAVTLWGRDGEDSLSPWDWAVWSGTIPYEVMTGVGCRVARRYAFEGRTWIEQPLMH